MNVDGESLANSQNIDIDQVDEYLKRKKSRSKYSLKRSN